nr:hypothetical protein [Tanacetum cinerariifolium]
MMCGGEGLAGDGWNLAGAAPENERGEGRLARYSSKAYTRAQDGVLQIGALLRGRFVTLGFKCLGVNVYTASYHEFVLLRMVLSTAHWIFSTASSLFIQLVSTASISRYQTTKIDGMADIQWHTELDLGQN